MIVQCSDCHASYSVDDSKVTNKKFGFACPKCGVNVVIDNREQHAADDILSGVSDDLSGSDAGFDAPAFQDSDISDTPQEPARVRSTTEASNDFVDFDLSSDDEELLRRVETTGPVGGETPVAEDSISLDDFDSTEGLDLDLLDTPSAPATRDSTTDLDLDSIIASDQTDSLPSGSVTVDARKKDYESPHVDQDDFRPLEEDPVLDDLDSIDSSESNLKSETESLDFNRSIKSEDILNETPEDTDESITIDLDSLDIQLDESSPSVSTGAQPPDDDFFNEEPIEKSELSSGISSSGDDEQDITLDLDSLDITLDEVEEFKEGVSLDDDDERLTLDDAGISIDQLEAVEEHGSDAEEDLKLSIDDINPALSIDALEVSDSSIINEINSDEMPEIDFDRLESEPEISQPSLMRDLSTGAMISATASGVSGTDEKYLDIETRESFDKYRHDVESYGDDGTDTVPRGAINFSIDYSLSHSRMGAMLRILGLYIIALIPHFLTLIIYSFLSQILGFLNWIIVVFTGRYIEDFIEIQENTLRYLLSIAACQTAAVDEMPMYGGREDIDYALQFNVIYPSKPSRLLAFLRISVIGMQIILIPHLILLTLLTFGSLIIAFAGLISIIAIKRWPNILFDFIVRYFRYVANVMAFMIGLVDKYPTFRFE